MYFKLEFGFGGSKRKGKESTPHHDADGWSFVKGEVERVRAEERFKTAANYLTAARSWSEYVGHDKWSFADMDAGAIECYQRWLADRGVCQNTSSAYMRALRVMYRRAMSGGDGTSDPFKGVFTGRKKTDKRSVSEEEIRQLCNLSLPDGSALAWARDIFLFGFYAMGMPFVDVAYLKKNQLHDGFIRYARHKTGQQIAVAVEPQMMAIIRRYEHPDSEYVFSILKEGSPEDTHRQYLCSLRRYDYSLRRLSRMISASRSLSSYVVRHSWASIAYQHHVSLEMISKAMGHTRTSTTLIYIKGLEDTCLAETNHALISDLKL